jgi:hypothetical protein
MLPALAFSLPRSVSLREGGQANSFSRCDRIRGLCTKGKAERRKAHCPTNVRAADKCTQSAQLICFPRRRAARLAARTPSGAHACGTRHRFHPMAQLQNRVSRGGRQRAFLPLRQPKKKTAAVKHAPCGPVFVPVDRGPRAARERIGKEKNPRAGTASRSAVTACRPERRPLTSETAAVMVIAAEKSKAFEFVPMNQCVSRSVFSAKRRHSNDSCPLSRSRPNKKARGQARVHARDALLPELAGPTTSSGWWKERPLHHAHVVPMVNGAK